MNRIKSLAASAVLLALCACGGGGSGGGGGGSSGGGTGGGNTAPTLTSPTSLDTDEQPITADPATVVSLSANDAEGDAVTFSILGTKDSALFTIANGRELQFVAPPSFETPQDSDSDNSYELDIQVSDGSLTTTAAITVQVNDTVEGLVVEPLANAVFGADKRAVALSYVDSTSQVFVVDELGEAFLLDARDGSVLRTMVVTSSASERVLDATAVDTDGSGSEFYVLTADGTRLNLLFANFDTGRLLALWSKELTVAPDATITTNGQLPVIAIGDRERNGAAQDVDDPRGNLFQLQLGPDTLFNLNTIDPADVQLTEELIGIGLRSPRLPQSDTLATRFVLDRGERFNEYTLIPFRDTVNFQWPARDGNAVLEFTGMLPGSETPPLVVQEIDVDGANGADGVGGWTDMATGLQGEGWIGVFLITDANGNFYTRGTENDEPLERRTLDFRNAGLISDPIISMDDGDDELGTARPIYVLDQGGSVFRVDLTQRD
ncbi:MAG: cadherin repeat domain-containing protein [Pseudomonadota bacterium]